MVPTSALARDRDGAIAVAAGDQLPTDDLVLRWLDTCNASELDRELIADLVEHREADPVIPQFAESWRSVEPQAAIIHAWALDVLPGQLQTYDYAHAIFIKGSLDEDRATARAAARVKRSAILDGPDGTRMTAILYEPILHGSPAPPRSWKPSSPTCWQWQTAPQHRHPGDPRTRVLPGP